MNCEAAGSCFAGVLGSLLAASRPVPLGSLVRQRERTA